ncbi:MAG TPA: aminotransferase class I/II-fold pyridoxal phosphate-dependent enzyme [Cyclobacteriaceae bacterium]|nr:aminotransferase class I/II-fold pyridoxal phosphate-dependent enzyme [Cyclobacteriaceae bacterium]
MLKNKEFRQFAHEVADWMANYLQNVDQYPVKSQVQPGDILQQIPEYPPENEEPMNNIFNDFKRIIIPGISHWQSPNWFAYFQANSSYPSILAEMITATLGAQCMVWETSPAAAELEERMMQWLKNLTGLPENFEGVIQDTASTSTLCAILTAREKASEFGINKSGFPATRYRVYCSLEAHSSIDKAVRISGLGHDNLVRIKTHINDLSMDPDALEKSLMKDIENGLKPLCVIATIGTTGTMAIDPLEPIGEICQKYKIWLHVDAAYAGTAMFLPEYRWMIKGIELADSYVFNPHKWMFTNFDCSAYYVKDKESLIRTFSIMPEYLKTAFDEKVNNYRDWGIQLGRRFRALKLWFVLRSYGAEGIRKVIGNHVFWAQNLAAEIGKQPDFEIMAPCLLNMICFRYHPEGVDDAESLNRLNEKLIRNLNISGRMYVSHTKIKSNFVIRFAAGQTFLQERHLLDAWLFIKEEARKLE